MKRKPIFLCLLCVFSISLANYTLVDYLLEDLVQLEVDPHACSGRTAIKAGVLELLNFIAKHYLKDCVNVILYDKKYEESEEKLNFDLEAMLKKFPANFINGQVSY